MEQSFQAFARRLRTQALFAGCESTSRSKLELKLYVPNPNWEPPHNNNLVERYLSQTKETYTKAIKRKGTKRGLFNISTEELHSLRRLAKNPLIKIVPADKNLGPVLVDTSFYEAEVNRHLGDRKTYKPLHPNQALAYCKKLVKALDRWTKRAKRTELITASIERYIHSFYKDTTLDKDSMAKKWNKFYLTIKIHKNPVKTRPITPSMNWLSTGLAKWIDAFYNLISRKWRPSAKERWTPSSSCKKQKHPRTLPWLYST